MRRLAVLALPLALLACGDDWEGTGKVSEMTYIEPGSRLESRAVVGFNGKASVALVQVDTPPRWLLDLVDEHGDQHEVSVPWDVYADCAVGEWYSTATGACS